ncbi:hypothetical protein L7F22_060469 [Adiantum nelumboides]|nr:hypothetical protein [Adiantum nelumboides]
MKQFLASDAKDKVLTEWRSLKLSPYESIHKYVDKFWDLHLKATVYKKIDFEELKQHFCAGLLVDMKEYVNSQRPRSILAVIHHTMVAAKINFQQGAKRNLKPMEAKEKQEYKGKNFSQNSSKGNSNNKKSKEKGVFKGKNRLTPEELERYCNENKCFKCGEQGHSYRSCHQRNPRNEQPRASMVEAPKEETAQHEAKVKQVELELAHAKADLELQKQQSEVLSKGKEAVGSLASTSQIRQAETHLHIQLPLMPEMPKFSSTQEEEQQRPAPGALDVREQLKHKISDMPEGPTKEYLLYEKKVMELAAPAFLQPEEQVKDLGHDFLPLPLMRHEAILWKEKMRPTVPQNEEGGYEAQLAREKIKEALKRKDTELVLEPSEGSPKKPIVENDEELEKIQLDPTPPSPSTIVPPAQPPSSPKPSPSPKSPKLPKSPLAPTSPQQQQNTTETTLIPPSSQPKDKQDDQPKDKIETKVKQADTAKPRPAEKELQIPLMQLEEPTQEEAYEEVKNFDYNKIILTLSRQFQCQKVVAQETDFQRTVQHEARVKELKQELAEARAELEIQRQRNEALLTKEKEAVGSQASTTQTSQVETHLLVHLPPMPNMPDLPSTSQHDEEHQGLAPGALDVRGDLEQEIEDMPEGLAKEFLQPKEQAKGLGHDVLPLPLMKHKAIVWRKR